MSANPERAVAIPRPAATVILLRDTAAGLETWLLRRVRQMAFAAGMSVFPGGSVDSSDGSVDVPWVGDQPEDDARRFGCTVDEARAALVGAVRETFEETGVLITQPPSVLASDVHASIRRDLEDRRLSFAAMLVDMGLSVDATLIRPWARWITPESEPRRFDTFFFVAGLPDGARAQADSGEATHAEWIRPADALAEFLTGDRPIMPPTAMNLKEIAGFDRVADVLAATVDRTVVRARPQIEVLADGSRRIMMADGTVLPFPAPAVPRGGS